MVPRVGVGWPTARLGRGMGNWVRERKEHRAQGTGVPEGRPQAPTPHQGPRASPASGRGRGVRGGRRLLLGTGRDSRPGRRARIPEPAPRVSRPFGSASVAHGRLGPTAGPGPGWHLNLPFHLAAAATVASLPARRGSPAFPRVRAPVAAVRPSLPAPRLSGPGQRKALEGARLCMEKRKQRRRLHRPTAPGPVPRADAAITGGQVLPASSAARWGPRRPWRLPWQRKHPWSGVTSGRVQWTTHSETLPFTSSPCRPRKSP